jgi:predicted phosphoadenosine phosphosulfate sulfurtransferase
MTQLQPKAQKPLFAGLKFHNMDVVEAAKRRLRYCVETYDEVIVSFSGGKDSLVVLELLRIVYKEMGRTDKVKFKFMDEELVCDSIIDFVKKLYESGVYDGRWMALQMYVGFFVMGKHEKFLSWDPKRPWHRQPPEYAVFDVGYDTSSFNENTIGRVMYPDTSKSTCVLTGVRAEESLKRYQAIRTGGKKGSETANWMGKEPGIDHVWIGKPIYDWSEFDVFKFFYDEGIEYCSVYDAQVWTKAPLRVASAMHEKAAGQFFKLKEMEPTFYEQLRAMYPEVETHYRYWKEVDQFAIMEKYAPTWDGLRQFVEEGIDESHQREAFAFIDTCEGIRKKNLSRDPTAKLGFMPVRQVFQDLIRGSFVKAAAFRYNVSVQDIDYELGISSK